MSYKLFIDDERFPPKEETDWVISRTSEEAKICVTVLGMPRYISFDHDLGEDDTAIVFIKWLEEMVIENNLEFPKDFEFYVHSQNPVGKENIEYKMRGLLEHFGQKAV